MSISDLIRAHVATGKLEEFSPPLKFIEVHRGLFLSADITEAFQDDYFADQEHAYRFGEIAADFVRFVSGKEITFGMDPWKKDNCAIMARLDPVEDGAVCVRLREPRPAVRIFGFFVAPDNFVAIRWMWRKNLGGMGDPRWKREIENARARWRDLFPDHHPLVGDSVDDYITENATAV